MKHLFTLVLLMGLRGAVLAQDGPVAPFGKFPLIKHIALGAEQPTCATASPDDARVAVGVMTNKAFLYDSDGKIVATLRGHRAPVTAVQFSPNSKILATAGADAQIMLWEADTGKILGALTGHMAGVRCLAFSPDGKTLASGADDYMVGLWDVFGVKVINALRGPVVPVVAVAFTPDGKAVRAAAFGQPRPAKAGLVPKNTIDPNRFELRSWDIATGEPMAAITATAPPFRVPPAFGFSPDAKLVAYTGFQESRDNAILNDRPWIPGPLIFVASAETGEPATTLRVTEKTAKKGPVKDSLVGIVSYDQYERQVARNISFLSPDIVASWDGATLRTWRVSTREYLTMNEVFIPESQQDKVKVSSLSPSTKMFITCGTFADKNQDGDEFLTNYVRFWKAE